jgi:ABC-2 type transport system permease protein
LKTFLALLHRDLYVIGKSLPFLLLGTMTQPILLVLVFGNILPRLGLVSDAFSTAMLPGLMSISILMAGVQSVLMPLVTDLGGSREVDERLLAPISVREVALGKIVAGSLHATLAGLLALPVMVFLMHRLAGSNISPNWVVLLPFTILAGLMSAAFGLTLGTAIQQRFTGLLFAVILGPMMMFGCAYYPWASLRVMGVLQYVFLINPLTFMSESMRYAVTPNVEHMPLPLLLGGMVLFTVFFALLGARNFERRTIL